MPSDASSCEIACLNSTTCVGFTYWKTGCQLWSEIKFETEVKDAESGLCITNPPTIAPTVFPTTHPSTIPSKAPTPTRETYSPRISFHFTNIIATPLNFFFNKEEYKNILEQAFSEYSFVIESVMSEPYSRSYRRELTEVYVGDAHNITAILGFDTAEGHMSFGGLVRDSPDTVNELLGTYFELSPSFQGARSIGVGSDGRVVIVATTNSPGDASTVGDDSSDWWQYGLVGVSGGILLCGVFYLIHMLCIGSKKGKASNEDVNVEFTDNNTGGAPLTNQAWLNIGSASSFNSEDFEIVQPHHDEGIQKELNRMRAPSVQTQTKMITPKQDASGRKSIDPISFEL